MKDKKTLSCPCPVCGEPKFYKNRIRKENINARCKKCIKKYGQLNSSPLFLRTCAVCGKNETKSKPFQSDTCGSCACSAVKKSSKNYVYFCPHCSSVRVVNRKRKTANCADCSKKYGYTKDKEPRFYFDFKEMKMIVPKPRYFRICPECPEDTNTIQVASKLNSGIKLCKHHSQLKNASTIKQKNSRKPKRKSSRISKEAVEKIRAINKAHRESVEKAKKIVHQRKSDDELIAEFLRTKEPSVKVSNEEIFDPYCGEVRISSSLEWA